MNANNPLFPQFLSARQRSRPIVLPEHLADEELARDWTLSSDELYALTDLVSQKYRLVNAVQLCTVRLFGRFLKEPSQTPPAIVAFLAGQLGETAPLTVLVPTRGATLRVQQKKLLQLVGFHRLNAESRSELESWLAEQARDGKTPATLFQHAERRLLRKKVLLPGPVVLERLVNAVCARTQQELLVSIHAQLSPDMRSSLDELLTVPEGEQRSFFYRLKEYPPSPTVTSIKKYLGRYRALQELFQGGLGAPDVEPVFASYLSQIARGYNAKDIKRLRSQKRHALMVCFLHESRKVVLDHLVEMHEKFVMKICRDSKSAYEAQHRALRKRQKAALDAVLGTATALLSWPHEESWTREEFWRRLDEQRLRTSVEDLQGFQRLSERGYADRLLARYSILRKYFAEFIQLPFAVQKGSEPLLEAIHLVRRLDRGELKCLPKDAPSKFVPRDLRPVLRDQSSGKINRNAWETGLALAIRDAFRSGDLFLPESKHHVSFWDLLLSNSRWDNSREESYEDLGQPVSSEVRNALVDQFNQTSREAEKGFSGDPFAMVENGRLKLKRDDVRTPSETRLQKNNHR